MGTADGAIFTPRDKLGTSSGACSMPSSYLARTGELIPGPALTQPHLSTEATFPVNALQHQHQPLQPYHLSINSLGSNVNKRHEVKRRENENQGTLVGIEEWLSCIGLYSHGLFV